MGPIAEREPPGKDVVDQYVQAAQLVRGLGYNLVDLLARGHIHGHRNYSTPRHRFTSWRFI